jgi:uncharacterized protein (DUF58 family)
LNPLAAVRARWQAWWQGRQQVADTHQLTQRNVYIVPTLAGLAFCGTLGVLLIASINEQMSLGYALTFALTGAGLASMHTTHANLRGLQLDLRAPEGVHVGDDVELEVHLHNPGAARYGIGLQVLGREGEPAWVDVPALGHATLQLRFGAEVRGLRELPRLLIITRFPLGFFRAWSYWRPASKVWVYPRAERPLAPFPVQAEAGDGESAAPNPHHAGTDFAGVRGYRRGDSLRQVLWRKSAMNLDLGLPLWVRETESAAAQELFFDWRDTAGRDIEARLSRLTAWVLAAERGASPYGLRLPSGEIEPSLGGQHQQACLERLAEFGGSA